MEDSHYPEEQYKYEELLTETSFRVCELLPGKSGDPICCLLHVGEWDKPREYEAISYAWGDSPVRAPVNVHGKVVEVTKNLREGLSHLRLQDESRFLWADALCTNQNNIPERNRHVAQMRKIYENATRVLIWLGPDTRDRPRAHIVAEELRRISDFLCENLGISIDSLDEYGDVYHDVIFKNRDKLPLPDEVEITLDTTWENLIWFYRHPYFTRVWVIQEINANPERLLHCGNEEIIWKRVHLVASYLMMETAWSKTHGFSSTYIWWVAIMSTERVVRSKNWLHVLYLASNFSTMDPKDFIFGLQGMFSTNKGAALLRPDYSKEKFQVYCDSVEAAFLDFQKTDVLLYTTGYGDPSWVPEWDKAMLFRNPFRFGKEMPWKPSGDTKPIWRIDREMNVLFLKGFIVDSIKVAVPYNEGYFGKAMADSKEGREQLKQAWQKIVTIWGSSQSKIPFSRDILTAAATSLSFGLDENANAADEGRLLLNFLAYLKFVLDKETYNKYVPPELTEESKEAKAESFGKPVWDFKYPESSFFVTERNLIGSSTSRNKPGDKVWVALGSTYPSILRPFKNQFLLKGFSYVHGIMQGELLPDSKQEVFEIH